MPWTALGFAERATVPRRFAVCFAELRDMAHLGGRSVLSPDTFDESFEPVELGLFDEWTFGRLRRDARGRVLLRSFFEEHPSERPQGWLFGALQLCEPVVHPWALRFAPYILERPNTPQIVCLPVLPAGYRPSVLEDGALATHPLTMHLTRLLNFGRRLERVKELEAPDIIVEGQRERVQMAMSALMIDGFIEFDDGICDDLEEREERLAEGEEPVWKAPSLREEMLRDGLFVETALWLEHALEEHPRILSSRWPMPYHRCRALLKASCLELVPLTAEGRVDPIALTIQREDELVHLTSVILDEAFGEAFDVLHKLERHDTTPHIDVHARRTLEGDAIVLLTGGMSSFASRLGLASSDEPFVEIACIVPPDTDARALQEIAWALSCVAERPHRRETFFAEGHTLELPRGIMDSPIRGFVFVRCKEPWAERLETTLPMKPCILVAVGLTKAELDVAVVRGSDAVMKAAIEALKMRTILRPRASIV